MQLSREDFEKKYALGELRIAFIGMSNIGKTIRSKQLQSTKNFSVVEVDHMIQKELGFTDMHEASKWMGYPFEPGYEAKESQYLELENRLTCVEAPPNKNFILDTTGSVVYLEDEVIRFLQEHFLVVGFDVSTSMLQEMEEEFFVTPKTIVWNGHFQPEAGERDIDALRRCYPSLLTDRMQRYRIVADVVLPGEVSRSSSIDGERFWEILRLSLPASGEGRK